MFFIKGGRGDPKTASSTKESHSSMGNFPKAVWMESPMSDIPAPPETLAVRTQEGMKGISELPLLFHKEMPIIRPIGSLPQVTTPSLIRWEGPCHVHRTEVQRHLHASLLSLARQEGPYPGAISRG